MSEPDAREVEVLLREAGRRESLPADELAAIEHEFLTAFRQQQAQPSTTGAAMMERPRRRRATWLLAAAALAIALGVGWWLRMRPAGTPPPIVATIETVRGAALADVEAAAPRAALRAGTVLDTSASDARMAVRLASGPGVRLDAGTRARIVSGGVIALERGRIYVDSAAAAHVEIRTPVAVVRDVGTQFTVGWSPAQRELRVGVRQGAVSAAIGSDGARVARAGEELAVDRDGVRLRPLPSAGDGWGWVMQVAPPFDSDGRTLAELLAWAAGETGWRIALDDEAARAAQGTVLHGQVGALPADRAVLAVLPGAGLAAEVRDGVLHVSARRAPR